MIIEERSYVFTIDLKTYVEERHIRPSMYPLPYNQLPKIRKRINVGCPYSYLVLYMNHYYINKRRHANGKTRKMDYAVEAQEYRANGSDLKVKKYFPKEGHNYFIGNEQ